MSYQTDANAEIDCFRTDNFQMDDFQFVIYEVTSKKSVFIRIKNP